MTAAPSISEWNDVRRSKSVIAVALATDPPSCTERVMNGAIFPFSSAGVVLRIPTISGTMISDCPIPETRSADPSAAKGVLDVICVASQ